MIVPRVEMRDTVARLLSNMTGRPLQEQVEITSPA